jgi:hypothetical protein
MMRSGKTDWSRLARPAQEPLVLNRRAAESDLVIYRNINFVPMEAVTSPCRRALRL